MKIKMNILAAQQKQTKLCTCHKNNNQKTIRMGSRPFQSSPALQFCLAIALWTSFAHSFTQQTRQHLGFAKVHSSKHKFSPSSSSSSSSRRTTNVLSASIIADEETNGQDVDNLLSDEDASKSKQKEVAMEALKKLLHRQQKQLQETEEMIKNLQDSDTAGIGYPPLYSSGRVNATETSYGAAKSIAASLLSGFDYGFVSRSEGCRFENVNDFNGQLFEGYGPPANIFTLGSQQFMRNLNAMRGEYNDEEDLVLSLEQKELRMKLKQLSLNSTAIWERERSRGPIVAPLVIKVPYLVLCYMLDVVFEGRYVPSRFFLLETVARMPYFSYITMLHLYETLGFWRRSKDVKRVHFAEEWNEFHHLLIMESLGGDQKWWVRFVAQHSAIVYFIVLVLLWAISPSLSYKFSELLETHAVDTYGQFLDENEELLKELPPSLAALDYYTIGVSDPMFGEYQTSAIASGEDIRKSGVDMKNLHDVFKAIRSDEGDHVGTMKACLDPNVAVVSPSLETRVLIGVALSEALGFYQKASLRAPDISAELLQGVDESLPAVENAAPSLFDYIASLIAGDEVDILFDPDFLTTIYGIVEQGFTSFAEALLRLLGFL